MKTLSDKLQAEANKKFSLASQSSAKAIRISGRILFWEQAMETAPNNMHLYKQFKEKEENKYYLLTGHEYTK